MSKTLMTVALLAALGLVAYVAIIQPAAAAPVAAAPASDVDEGDGWLSSFLGGWVGTWGEEEDPSTVGPAFTVA